MKISNKHSRSTPDRIAKKIKLIVFDFDGVFTDNRVLVLQDGTEGVFCSRADGIGLELLRRMGLHLLVFSTENNPVVGMRCRKLKIPYLQGIQNKKEILIKEAEKHKVHLSEIAYIGNDINDLGCLSIVGFPVCVADAHPSVRKVAIFKTKEKGGYGAVREFCDYLERKINLLNAQKG